MSPGAAVTELTTVWLRYRRGVASAEEISAEVDEILVDLDNVDGELVRSTPEIGVECGGVECSDRAGIAITVQEGGQGFDPVLTSMVVGVTVRATTEAAEAFWTKVVLPRLRRRLGPRVVLDREDGPEELSA
jgi:hypothetical protein